MFGYFLTLRRRRSETPEFDGEQRPRRKWKYIFVIITIDLLFVTAIAQLLLGLLLFNYVEVPASLLIGEILTLVASVLSILLGVLHFIIARRYRYSNGQRNKSSFLQNVFFWLASSLTTIWWVSILTGSYIFTKGLSDCPVASVKTVIAQVGTPCRVYEISVCGSISAFIFSIVLTCIFVKCRRPFILPSGAFRPRRASKGDENGSPFASSLKMEKMLTLNAYLTPAAYPSVTTRLSSKRTSWLPPIPIFNASLTASDTCPEPSTPTNSKFADKQSSATASPPPTYISPLITGQRCSELTAISPLTRSPSLSMAKAHNSHPRSGSLRSTPSSVYSQRSRSTTSSRSSASSQFTRYYYPVPQVPAIPAGYTRKLETPSTSLCPVSSAIVRRSEEDVPKRPTTTPEMPPLAFLRYAARQRLLPSASLTPSPPEKALGNGNCAIFMSGEEHGAASLTNSIPRMPSFASSFVYSRPMGKENQRPGGKMTRGASYEDIRKEPDPFSENPETRLEKRDGLQRAGSKCGSRRIVKMRQPGD